MAKQQGREMVNEARAYRERVLSELARRRELARQQIEQLMHGRDRLLQAFERSRLVAVDVMAELTPLGEPSEYVDLSPTTGPVPLMLPNMPRPGQSGRGVPHDQDVAARRRPIDEPSQTMLTDRTRRPSRSIEVVEVDRGPEVAGRCGRDRRVEADADGRRPTMHEQPERIVKLDISPSDHSDHIDDPDREPAQVVALFDIEREPDDEPSRAPTTSADDTTAMRTSADDLFARLRAARAEGVAQRVIDAEADDAEPADRTSRPKPARDRDRSPPTTTATFEAAPVAAAPSEDSVFLPTPEAPAVEVVVDDTPFARRDEALTPIIVAAARKLKRVLADEQNEVLHALRRKEPVRTDRRHARLRDRAGRRATWRPSAPSCRLRRSPVRCRWACARRRASARSRRPTPRPRPATAAGRRAGRPVARAARTCIGDADGDNGELATLVRVVYREWKTQRIDEHLDDVARTAFGRGALAGVAPGTPICWIVDPTGRSAPTPRTTRWPASCRPASRSPPIIRARPPTAAAAA